MPSRRWPPPASSAPLIRWRRSGISATTPACAARAAPSPLVVLTSPPDPIDDPLHDRALLAVIAAREAVAIAGGPIDERQLAELEVALAVSAEAAQT